MNDKFQQIVAVNSKILAESFYEWQNVSKMYL